MARWTICTLCSGDGTHVNPAIDAHGISAEEFNEDPEFRESYMRGDYDVQCARCNGTGKVRAAELAAAQQREDAAADARRLRAAEDGDWESYLTAGDPRWGQS